MKKKIWNKTAGMNGAVMNAPRRAKSPPVKLELVVRAKIFGKDSFG